MKSVIPIILLLLLSSCAWGEDNNTYQDYYIYAEEVFYYNHMGDSFYEKDKNDFCITMATQLYNSKADLKKLKKEMRDNDAISRFGRVISGYKKEYREWGFVNGKGLLTPKIIDNGKKGAVGGYSFEDINYETHYKTTYEGWFSHYITLETLEKKWKGKPAPKGYDEFIKKYKAIHF